jgi:hypothetical protein
MKINGIAPFLLGIALICWGVLVMVHPKYYHRIYSYYFDFTGYSIPFGVALIGIGLIFIWTTLRKAKRKG